MPSTPLEQDTQYDDVPDAPELVQPGTAGTKEASSSAINYGELFPFGSLTPSDCFSKETRWVLAFGLIPLAILYAVFMFQLTFDQSAWLIGGYFCYFWAVYFNGLIQPARSLSHRGIAYCFFTAFIGIPILLFWQQLPVISAIYAGTENPSFVLRLFTYIVGVGVLEETCKAMPLLLFSLRKGPLGTRDGVYLGILSGLGFALAEVVQYSVGYWQQAAQTSAYLIADAAQQSKGWIGNLDEESFYTKLQEIVPTLGERYGWTMLIQTVRFIPLPLLHAAWAGTVGYFIAVASRREDTKWHTISVGIGGVAVIHGLYNVFSGSVIGFVMAAISILILMAYLKVAR